MPVEKGSMLRLILVRHGETDWNVTLRYQGQGTVPLNALGREQAQRTAQRLVRLRITALYASDVVRAWETATIIGNIIGMEPRPMPAFREIDVGKWEGYTPEELEQRYPEHMREYHNDRANTVRLGGESYAQLQQRAVLGLRQIREHHQPGELVVVVAHGGTIRTLICHILGVDLALFGRMWLENGSLTELRYDTKGWRIYRVNDAAHLEGMTTEAGDWFH